MTSKADKFISSGVPLEINFKDRPYSSYVESHLWLNFEALISFSTPLRRPQSSTQVTFYSKIFFNLRLKNIFPIWNKFLTGNSNPQSPKSQSPKIFDRPTFLFNRYNIFVFSKKDFLSKKFSGASRRKNKEVVSIT